MAAVDTQALFLQLAVLLTLATGAHFLFRRLHQPALIGEITIGIILGPSVLGNPGLGPYRYGFDPAVVAILAVLGSIFLLFLIGLEFDFRAVYTTRNIAVASGGVILPLVTGFVAALYLVPTSSIGTNGARFTMALFVGATLTATSVAITAAVLLEFGFVKDEVGKTILGAAVVDDVLGLIVLSVVVGTAAGRVSAIDLGILLAEAVGFLVIGMALGVYVFRRLVAWIQRAGKRAGIPQGGFLIAIAIAFLFSLLAEAIGLSAVVGAFLAGSVFATSALGDEFSQGARYLAAVFTPIFFVSLGLQVNVPAVAAQGGLVPFAIVLMAIAVIGKVVGCSLPARLAKMTRRESVAVGWGMTPRGEVGLIVVFAALSAGVIGDALFSMLVFVLILVTILPTPVFKWALNRLEAERARGPTKPSDRTDAEPPER